MQQDYIITTERLGLRMWKKRDRMPFERMNAKTTVMKYFPKILSRNESDAFIDRIMQHFSEKGFGLLAVEHKGIREFMGFIGFYTGTFEADFTPCVEIGWRLDDAFWHKGYATEGALACLQYGFTTLGFDEVYSFTSEVNIPSIRVMERIGMKKSGTFLHPAIDRDSPLRPHVLYKIDKITYDKQVLSQGGYHERY